MGLFSALFAGVNGLNANGNVISVIGDNIANVNTIGYKSSRASFEDILAGADSNTGLGSRVSNIRAQFGQGGFESSSSVTDMAIDGKGFFVLQNSLDGSVVYSRAGQFSINSEGYLVNADNLRVRGYQVASNVITSSEGDIKLSQTPVPPNKTGTIGLSINLNANSVTPAAFSTANPTGTSNFSAGLTIYDSLGNSHLVTIYFRKSASNSWSWHALVDGGELTSPSPGVNVQSATGTLTFSNAGALASATTTSTDFDFLGATQTQAITFDFGKSTDAGGTGLAGATQFGSASAITNITQDGYSSGSLKSLAVSTDGIMTGNYTNGTTQKIAQIVLANFNNVEALSRGGSNNYLQTLESGNPLKGPPGSGGKGTIVSGTLEQSNVDLANELIKMVIIQRGFQANSRTISTVNDLLSQLVTLGQ